MVVTIDHACFPHIFSDIIGYCDVKTQHKLRFLCTSVKLEVDRLQCSEITFILDIDENSSGHEISCPERAILRLSPWGNYSGKISALCPSQLKGGESSNMTTCIQPEYVAALRNAHTVSTWSYDLMWDDLWAARALQAGTSYHSPFKLLDNATRLELVVGDLPPPAGALVPAQVAIPSTVQRLQFRQEGDDMWMFRSTLLHNCHFLRFFINKEEIVFSQEQDKEEEEEGKRWRRRFFTSLLRPCVQHVLLDVDEEGDATAYFNAVKGKNLHPDLRVEVLTYHKWSQEREDELRDKLVKIIPVKVIVRESVRGEDW
ncbi:hypothetical protein A1Q1_06844 [Trichosporon asahii var. asahii CBS 2479]|uniref:F-box domain-containing protein n=1 Tax=Trichosporon asahii var. asahii (strain ATCC 90039 / CBS 2479 / JCM 2466 / KCTC 7840 / NBRC 103889/ NCYC 2677 / UAMH 7654) TaxID=1186058 RepID=J5TP65_TRIAS|nr:hypothetical protein A1Q1_06844 [Trichosporon asahii var. asahii CBS 2479]EJT51921.1 hypothetical protein A1Q1_06844 [Trichosporon asahii var. asahii CBS 2479]